MGKTSGVTLIELLVVCLLVWILAALVVSGASRALKKAKDKIEKIEFAHFGKTIRYIGEPDPTIIDPATGREMFYTRHPHFTNYLFTIDPD